MRSGVTPSGIAYSVLGQGPPLLWLSGFVVTSTAMERYVAQFSTGYTCIVFDARGSGRTRSTIRQLTTGRMAEDALEVLGYLGYESAHVHGVSLGGMVAQEMAIRAPHRVRTLVLGSTTAGGSAATPARVSTMASSVLGSHAPIPGAESVSWWGALQQALAASRHDAASRLNRVQAPCLVMHGERDRLLPPDNARELARLVPGAQLHVIEGVGHFYPMNTPEVAADIALDWM
ncbi:MAG: alpha/beta hydrolase, partial [Marmoricola sp.]